MSAPLHLCRDCRWRSGLWREFYRCAQHDVSPVRVDLVTGTTAQKKEYCSVARLRGHICGLDGLRWEARS